MAKGAPTAEASTGYGVSAAAPSVYNVKPAAGASMTKAPAADPTSSGWWANPGNLPAGVTGQWARPAPVSPVTLPATSPVNLRDSFAQELHRGVGSASHGDRQGATTSGRDSWGGSSGGRGAGGGGGHW